jgi:tetratricopeptide (TPR) repeat protein
MPAQQGFVELEQTPQPAIVKRRAEPVTTETAPSPVQVETRTEASSRPALAPAGARAQPGQRARPPTPERFYSAGRRAEPRLWVLLNAGRYQDLEQEIARLQARDPRWQPPPELLHWLRHHLAEEAEVTARDKPSPGRKGGARSAYSRAVQRAIHLQSQNRITAAREVLAPWQQRIEARQDARTLALLGWLQLKAGEAGAALQAFSQAYRWRPSAASAQGELLALAKLSQTDRLIAQARAHSERWPGVRPTAADTLRTLASILHQQGRYQQAQRLLDAAMPFAPAARDTALLTAWNRLKLGQPNAAAQVFSELYQQQPDTESAEGLLTSMQQQGAATKLALLAQEPGPLRQRWLRDQRKRFIAQGEPIRAYRIDPAGAATLVNIDSPAATLGQRWRTRSGDPGLGRLNETRSPLFQYRHWLDLLEITLDVDRVTLDAGTADDDALIGSASATLAPAQRRAASQASQVNDGLAWTLGLAAQGDWRFAAQIGQTPTGGALDARFHGRARIGRRDSDYSWNATLDHQPMRESLLSYAGLVDPASGVAWGGVSRSGLTLDGWYRLNRNWTLAGRLQAQAYRGSDVADNSSIAGMLALGRNLQQSRFAYLTLGPVIEYQHFRRNLNHFTLGHGGYYSPEQDLGLMLALDFQSREAAPWLVQGSARAGWRSQEEAASPWFPLGTPPAQSAHASYEATSESGLAASLRLAGIAQLGHHWQLGAALSGNYSRQFEEYSGGLFMRWMLRPRSAVFSTDLPGMASTDQR